MEHRLKLDQLAAMYVLGTLAAGDLPAVAVDALEAGYDSPSLRQLASTSRFDTDGLGNLFTKTLNELGVPIPSPSEAGLELARRIAESITRGTVSPYDGARQIWEEVYTRFPQLAELRPFVGFASEYEDDEVHRDVYSNLIIEESKKLLAGRGG